MMTEDRFDRCCWWYIALLVICVLAIVGVMLVVSLLEADHDAPEPPTETVETVGQAEYGLVCEPAPDEGQPLDGFPLPGPGPDPVTLVETIIHVDELCQELRDNYQGASARPTFVPFEYENYLGWRTSYRAGWDKLVEYGRYRKNGLGPEPPMLDPMMELASDDAYATYCCMTFVRLSGYPGSCFCNEEYALYFVRTLRERGRSWEVGLAIAREESTWGTNPRARNLFGVCDPGIDMSDPILGYCAFLDKWCGARDEMAWILNCGGYNPSTAYHQNILRLSTGIRGEAY